MPHLFAPLDIDGFVFPNRIAVSPMCQYSATDGAASDWHIQHWMTLGMSGAGAVTVEATAVERRGRITHGCLGLYSDDDEAAAKRALDAAKRVAIEGTRFGVQLAHAGRKASAQRPWDGGVALKAGEDPWPTVGPSTVPYADGWHVPAALDAEGIAHLVESFVAAAKRAQRAGFHYVELHGAHGYLMHEFLSPYSNRREDEYGGPLANRMRLILDVARAVRTALPKEMLVGARLSASEWTDGGFTPDEAVVVAHALKEAGVGYVCASSGGNVTTAKIPVKPLYQVPLAEKIRRESGIATRAVGLITEPEQAEAIVAEGRADIVALGRAILADPRWGWRAAAALGHDLKPPLQYQRALPTMTKWAAPAGGGRAAA